MRTSLMLILAVVSACTHGPSAAEIEAAIGQSASRELTHVAVGRIDGGFRASALCADIDDGPTHWSLGVATTVRDADVDSAVASKIVGALNKQCLDFKLQPVKRELRFGSPNDNPRPH